MLLGRCIWVVPTFPGGAANETVCQLQPGQGPLQIYTNPPQMEDIQRGYLQWQHWNSLWRTMLKPAKRHEAVSEQFSDDETEAAIDPTQEPRYSKQIQPLEKIIKARVAIAETVYQNGERHDGYGC
jgi:hypothetical protein